MIDEEVSKIIERAYEKAKDILSQNREKLDQLSQKLLEREVIFKADLEEVLGARQWEERNVEESPVQPAAPVAPAVPEAPTEETPSADEPTAQA